MSYPIKFPRDEQAHDKIIEWWYWNGHLRDQAGNRYAFMDCLFKADARKVKLPFLKSPFKNIYFSHSLLSDIGKQKFYPVIDYVSVLSKQSFQRPFLFAEYISADPLDLIKGYTVNLMKESAPGTYRIKTENFDLKLKARKNPLLEGGKGFFDLSGRKTYYYSLTDLSAEGEIFISGKPVKVEGQAWMDHQWADAPYAKDRWTWFSIQLGGRTELVVFEYGRGKTDSYAGLVYPDGKTEHFNNVKIIPTGESWKSPKTAAKYELGYTIEIPERTISLQIKPQIKKQEMIFGTLNYWEGPISVNGFFGKKKVAGSGFLELVGRPSQYGALNLFTEAFKKIYRGVKNGF